MKDLLWILIKIEAKIELLWFLSGKFHLNLPSSLKSNFWKILKSEPVPDMTPEPIVMPISNQNYQMSQASFSQFARNTIRGKSCFRCMICLKYTPTAQCTHVIDPATPGEVHVCHKNNYVWPSSLSAPQHCDAIELGILPADYQGNAAENSLLCLWRSA